MAMCGLTTWPPASAPAWPSACTTHWHQGCRWAGRSRAAWRLSQAAVLRVWTSFEETSEFVWLPRLKRKDYLNKRGTWLGCLQHTMPVPHLQAWHVVA